jgi:energy-coupling factor transporter transmembrane protein EcfT
VRAELRAGLLIPALAGFVVSLFLSPGPVQAGIGFAVIALVAAQDLGALRVMGKVRFWVGPVIFFALSPFFIGSPDALVWGRHYSLAQLAQGAAFLLHAYVFAALAALVSRNVSAHEAAAWMEGHGARRFGLRLALALIAMKLLRRMLLETFGQYRRQRPGTALFLRDLPVLASAVTGNCVRLAENIAVLFYIRGVRV